MAETQKSEPEQIIDFILSMDVKAGELLNEQGCPLRRLTPDDIKGITFATKRVLIVDDEMEILSITKMVLNTFGYECATANNGKEGLAAFISAKTSKPFDLVLTDQVMPELYGTQLAQEIRKIDDHTPLIKMTGFDGRSDGQRLQYNPTDKENAPFLFILGKPFDIISLKCLLSAVFIRQVLNETAALRGEKKIIPLPTQAATPNAPRITR